MAIYTASYLYWVWPTTQCA